MYSKLFNELSLYHVNVDLDELNCYQTIVDATKCSN